METLLEHLEHFLFAAYLVFFAWLITRIKFFTKSGLTNSQLIILFLLKVMAGIFYGWIGVYYGEMAQMIDTWAYHYSSLNQWHLLQSHPVDFFTEMFHNDYAGGGYTNFLTSHDSFWNDAKATFLIKVLALFNVFSFGHYYVNVIFYSFLTLFGPVAIYRVMQDIFPARKLPVLLATFLIPSFLYWTSGLHKEGLIFTGLALMIYCFYYGFKEKRFSAPGVALILLSLLLVIILRNFLILPLLPPLIAWILSSKTKLRPLPVFIVVFALAVLLFFTSKFIVPGLDLPRSVALKQQEFASLGGKSAVKVNMLQPTVTSFAANLPQAISMSAIRPYPSDVRHLLSLAAALEINALLFFFIVFLIFRKRSTHLSSFLLFCLFFSFAVLLMIGYSVNILGAIVRYRSIVLPFLIIPMAAKTDWARIEKQFTLGIRNNNHV